MEYRRWEGGLSALGAFVLWGFAPLFWVIFDHVPPIILVFHRFIWASVILWLFHILRRSVRQVFQNLQNQIFRTAISALLLFSNWVIFSLAIQADQTISASLGYAMLPVLNILIAVIFFHEALKPLEWVAVIISVGGVVYFLFATGSFSLYSAGVAVSFGLYGASKKHNTLRSLQALTLETSFIAVICLMALLTFAPSLWEITWSPLLPLAGIVTAAPLALYNIAIKRLSYAQVAFYQYLTPLLMFFLSLVILQEDLPSSHIPGYIIIWASLLVYIIAQKIGPSAKSAA